MCRDHAEQPSEPNLFIQVAIPSPLRQLFDYLPPKYCTIEQLKAGVRVTVPFGHRTLTAIIVGHSNSASVPLDKLKPIFSILDAEPVVDPSILTLCQWAARYYHHSLGDTLIHAIPKVLREGKTPSKKQIEHCTLVHHLDDALINVTKNAHKQRLAIEYLAAQPQQSCNSATLAAQNISRATLTALEKKGLITQQQQIIEPIPFTTIQPFLNSTPLTLNDSQQLSLEAIVEVMHEQQYRTFLLDGITGSGKTEVYLQAIEAAIRAGKQSLVLIPEIGLTPQTIRRFRDRFTVPVVCLHSGLNDTERLQGWLDCANSSAAILIATRSGVFTPLPQLGLVIVDEEHDSSYKQQDSLRYNARDLAIYRGHQSQCPVILGSATPSLESYHNAQQGKFSLLELRYRAASAKPPAIKLVDIRQQNSQCGLTENALQQILLQLQQEHQVMIFLNRRGYAPSMICHDCGQSIDCLNCDACMTLHRTPPHLHCHHCDMQQAIPLQCAHCHSHNLQPVGQGTEQIEQLLNHYFAAYPVIRIDRDSTSRKNAMDQLLAPVLAGEPCLLLGTQMLAKGHHFPNVTLVVIVNADSGLFSGDFRGIERIGQLITQVSGRAGRGEKAGSVLIQTHNPQHLLLQQLATQPYRHFLAQVLQDRRLLHLPPFTHMALFRTESFLASEGERLLSELRQQFNEEAQNSGVWFLGPLPAPMERRQNRFRYHLMVQSYHRNQLHLLLNKVVAQLASTRFTTALRWQLDVDPQDMS